MSTISKLDRTVRAARAARKATIDSLIRVRHLIHGHDRVIAEATLADLIMIRKRPNRTGLQKSEAFSKIIQRLMPMATQRVQEAA